jgi:hypothetical protein
MGCLSFTDPIHIVTKPEFLGNLFWADIEFLAEICRSERFTPGFYSVKFGIYPIDNRFGTVGVDHWAITTS